MQLCKLALCLAICLTSAALVALYLNFYTPLYDVSQRWYQNFVLDHFNPGPQNASADMVHHLPGLDDNSNNNQTTPLSYRHYSGYLESIDDSHLFYWFFESQSRSKEKDPVVLWLNGGPGCSSLFGALSELGPLHLALNGTLVRNPFAWNARANLFFMESPPGTGFSYQSGATRYVTNDEATARVNFGALKSFFAKFPHLRTNRFYITGESYAGHYVPQLAAEVLKRGFPPNLGGIAIGNGYLDLELEQRTSMAFYEHHNLIDFTRLIIGPLDPQVHHKIYKYNIGKHCNATYASQYGYVSRYTESQSAWLHSNDTLQPCGNEHQLTEWLNRPEVRQTLHVRPHSGVDSWTICSLLKTDYMEYREHGNSMDTVIRQLVESGVKTVIYSGDMDVVCNFMAAQRFMDKLGFAPRQFNRTTHEEPWIFNNQSIGSIWRYEKNLTFILVHGAGHMVPIDKPEPAQYILHKFLMDD